MLAVVAVALKAAAGDEERLRFEAPGQAAAVYQTAAPLDESQRPFAEAAARRWPELGFSACLSRTAESYLHATTRLATNDLPHELLEFLARRAGCPEPPIIVTVASTERDGMPELLDHLDEVVTRAKVRFSHLGVARIPSPKPPFDWRWAVVLSRRQIHLEPVPAVLEPGSTAPLRFELEGGLEEAWVEVVRPGGEIEVPKITCNGTVRKAAIAAGEVQGLLWVMIRARSGSGEVIVAHFDLQVGQPRSGVWLGPPIPDEGRLDTPEAVEQLMVELVNADRTRFGLPSFVVDPSLAAVARAHSWDMAENDFTTHVSPRFGGLTNRLAMAGYQARTMRENVARATSISEAQASLMTSPDHRANLMAEDVTRLGIGVARSRDSGSRQWLVTQIFADPVMTLSAEQLEELVLGQVRARRQGRGLLPLRRRDDLDHWAQILAHTAVEEGRLDPGSLAAVQRGLGSGDASLPRVRAAVIRIDDLAIFELTDMVEHPGLQGLGIGVERRRGERGEVVSTIVVLVADR